MYIAAIFIFIITAICFISIKFKIYFCLAARQFRTELTVAGIKISLKHKPKKKVRLPYDILKSIAESIKIKYFMLNVLLGFDDPIADVFAVQLLRNTVSAVYALFKNAFNKNNGLFVKIMPAFNQCTVTLNFNCIISIRLGYIIKAFTKHYTNKLTTKIRRSFT